MTHIGIIFKSIYHALRVAVDQCGGPKAVGIVLWPHKSVEHAHTLLLNCLDANRAEKLDPEQVVMLLRMAREADFHLAKHFIDAETGYLPSTPADPTEEQARLVAVIETAGAQLQRALETLDRMRERPAGKVRAV